MYKIQYHYSCNSVNLLPNNLLNPLQYLLTNLIHNLLPKIMSGDLEGDLAGDERRKGTLQCNIILPEYCLWR